ncbi:hypothetical protein QF032_007418 [Streptomyces achromogenes]|uniref:DUF3626 domain-containing protein n=2 Tax=Streptomyces achromogenes TaxID=67255 RepID=A0ABU0QEV7_STRAH|nr:hypothetical protein [Streptomyces achromogenes]MDQ0835574.1 hypothetical protein [Streptomyces achromogenes]
MPCRRVASGPREQRRLPGGDGIHVHAWTGPGDTARMISEVSHTPQERALRHVATLASGPPMDPTLRVTLNFHPDRVFRDRLTVEALAEDGLYRSQFVTGTGNGGLTAHPGGDRWAWESRIFDGAYDAAPAHDRPVYGALNFRRKPAGGAPRFGSAHFRLTVQTATRTTFCYPDSFLEPSDFGVASRMRLIALALADRQDDLDDYIEAQVHGPVRLDRHVEALVLDACYRGTAVEAAAMRLGCPVEWHSGFRLQVEELRRRPGYRGQEYVDLGARIAVDGVLDPRILGDAARDGRHDPQAVKKVWHCLARFGAPVRTNDTGQSVQGSG